MASSSVGINKLSHRLLERGDEWQQRRVVCTPTKDIGTVSLRQRLEAINNSSESWRSRVVKDSLPLKSASARRPSNKEGQENARVSSCDVNLPSSKSALLLNLDRGLDNFFERTPRKPATTAKSKDRTADDSSNAIDLDSIAKTDILCTPKRALPRSVRQMRKDARALDIRIDISIPDEEPEEVVVIEDDGEPIAKSAREGLQSVEDYSAVRTTLKQANTASPFPALMLIRIKGEKKVDVRLVAPLHSSIHEAAVFIVVTPEKLYKYEGSDANILEKTKACQMCINILTKSDLFCTASKVETLAEDDSRLRQLLGESPKSESMTLTEEPFENVVAKANLFVRINEGYQMESIAKGQRARFSMLNSNETLILDFGSEIYVWSGRNANKKASRYAMEYAQQLRKKAVTNSGALFGEQLGEGRADWVILRRVFQGCQDTLFAAKFSDWQTSETKTMGNPLAIRTPTALCINSPKRCDTMESRLLAEALLEHEHNEPKTILESYEITREMKDIVTESLNFWVLDDEALREIENTSVLSSDQCYVIRWQYRIQVGGIGRLRGDRAIDKETGRERFVYFYWLGALTTPKQQGLCALKLSHMDKDKHTHFRLSEGLESPLFLSLFEGKLIITRSDDDACDMFLVGGATTAEAHAVQLCNAPLRPHAVYLKINSGEEITLVAGTDSNATSVRNGLQLAEVMKSARIMRVKADAEVRSMVQGDENLTEWLPCAKLSKTLRLYRLYDREGAELESCQYHKDLIFSFPQAALQDTILADTGKILWVWSDKPASTFALRVAEHMAKERGLKATVILKHNEPESFQALFPAWNAWPVVVGETSPSSPPRHLKELMDERTQTFSLEQLRDKSTLPEGIDTTNLEMYLNDETFEKTFKMTKEAFGGLAQWRQIRLRKDAGLF